MAVTFRLGSAFTSGVDFNTFSSGSASSATMAKPSGVTDGVMLRAFVFSQVSAGAAMTPPAGWTLEVAPTGRRAGVYRRPVPVAASETATSYTWSTASAGRYAAAIWVSTGEDLNNPVDVVGVFTTEATTATAAALSPTNAATLLVELVYWNNSTTTASTVNFPGGATKLIDVSSPTTGNTSGIAVGVEQLSASGSTGTRAFTATPTPTNMSAVMIAYAPSSSVTGSVSLSGAGSLSVSGVPAPAGPVGLSGSGVLAVTGAPVVNGAVALSGAGSLTAVDAAIPFGTVTLSGGGVLDVTGQPSPSGAVALTGSGVLTVTGAPTVAGSVALGGSGVLSLQTPLQKWMSTTPMNVAHRGGSADWPEMTMYAYAQAAAWNPTLALEVSVIRTSDGQWMASHDSTTTRVFGVNYDITTTPWSTLQTLRTTVGNQPPCLLQDVLAAYPDRITFVDDKMNSWLPQFLDVLDAYGGPSRIVVKGYGPQAGDITKAQAAIARGYQTWGYYYHADTASLASTQANWSILGEDAVGSPPGDATDWAAIKSYGKPVLAHIIATAAQKTYADTFAPSGYMASGVTKVVPQAGVTGTVALSGSGSLAVAGKPVFAGSVGLSGAGTQTVAGTARAAGTTALAGAGVLTVTSSPQYTGAVVLPGIGTLTVTGTTGERNITVYVSGPTRHPLRDAYAQPNPLRVSGGTR